MATYEDRKAKRTERLLNAAGRAHKTASDAFGVADAILDVIPMGQPILVGHHSERRHRRDLAKVDSSIRTGIDAEKHAEHLERLAAHVPAISSDCDDAVDLLREKLIKLEAGHGRMKLANKRYPATDWAAHLSEDEKAAAESNFQFWPGGPKRPFPSLTSSSANIRRVRERIAELEERTAAPTMETIAGPGWEIREDRDERRLVIQFDRKPDREMLAALRSGGFKWSPTRGAHIRMMSNGAIAAARRIFQLDRTEP